MDPRDVEVCIMPAEVLFIHRLKLMWLWVEVPVV